MQLLHLWANLFKLNDTDNFNMETQSKAFWTEKLLNIFPNVFPQLSISPLL